MGNSGEEIFHGLLIVLDFLMHLKQGPVQISKFIRPSQVYLCSIDVIAY